MGPIFRLRPYKWAHLLNNMQKLNFTTFVSANLHRALLAHLLYWNDPVHGPKPPVFTLVIVGAQKNFVQWD